MRPIISPKLFVLLLSITLISCEKKPLGNLDSKTITQFGTINNLYEARYDGLIDIKTTKDYGDFGLGGYTALDGELVILDNIAYQINADGIAKVADSSTTISFATITKFDTEYSTTIDKQMRLVDAGDLLVNNNHINIDRMYAVKITGEFDYILYRSFPKQSHPYRPLDQLNSEEKRHIARGVSATLVGFYFPQWFGQVNTNGFHYHFISKDRTIGGHVLEANLANATISMKSIERLVIIDLPFQTIQPETIEEQPPVVEPPTINEAEPSPDTPNK